MPESVRDRCTKSHEYIFLFSKSQNYYFDVDAIKEPTRRKRSVWNVQKKPYRGAHFAVYPPDLIEPCILAGSEEGDIVLDPFIGSGTTAAVAKSLGRNYIGCELHEEYGDLIQKRIDEYEPVVEVTQSTLLDIINQL
jgi:DNA modification methylase